MKKKEKRDYFSDLDYDSRLELEQLLRTNIFSLSSESGYYVEKHKYLVV